MSNTQDYRVCSARAADAERRREFKKASSLWFKAFFLARLTENRDWARVRQELCERRSEESQETATADILEIR